jgi:hypothetical protein
MVPEDSQPATQARHAAVTSIRTTPTLMTRAPGTAKAKDAGGRAVWAEWVPVSQENALARKLPKARSGANRSPLS